MALEPITRQEQIIAGKDLEPITRLEKFLKEYAGSGGGGSGGSGGSIAVDSELSDTSENPVQNKVVKAALDALAIPTLHITVNSLDMSTMVTTITADKTFNEMFNVAGPTWCVITVPESISPTGQELVFECSSYKRGFSFGYGLVFTSDLTGGIAFVVDGNPDDGWTLNFKFLM